MCLGIYTQVQTYRLLRFRTNADSGLFEHLCLCSPCLQHTSAYVSIRQHTAYVSIRGAGLPVFAPPAQTATDRLIRKHACTHAYTHTHTFFVEPSLLTPPHPPHTHLAIVLRALFRHFQVLQIFLDAFLYVLANYLRSCSAACVCIRIKKLPEGPHLLVAKASYTSS